tara:strand:+ start:73268 stop:73849 length:582 start_codon:yes stop_codon:yes gene_type:complete
MIEVELKFPVTDAQTLREQLDQLGGRKASTENHVDTYFNHPCRDFAETSEALRIRKIDGLPYVTYKGAKLPGEVKARRELEWSLGESDGNERPNNGSNMQELLTLLGFREVANVHKCRESYVIEDESGPISVTIDRVEQLGTFAEVEVIAEDDTQVETARTRVTDLAKKLKLENSEPRSYLRLLLVRREGQSS